MKYYFIINPNSGKNKKQRIEEKIANACARREVSYEIFYTRKEGEAKMLVQSIECEDECVVFSVGGDGNINEIVNGIAGTDKMLGVIPTGSGNDFYKTLMQLDNGIFLSDLGKINGTYFINIACIGLDADIANNIPLMRTKKWIPVKHRYTFSIIYTYIKYKFKKLKISLGEDIKEGEYTIMTVCNGQYYGGGYRIAPHAIIDDGFFDIYLVSKMPKPAIANLLLLLKKEKHEKSKRIRIYMDSKVKIESDEDMACNIDGETIISKAFEIQIDKSAIKIFNDKKFVKEILDK